MRPTIAQAIFLLTACLISSATAQDAGLYKNIADPNAAFVRIVSAKAVIGRVQARRLSTEPNGISAYVQTAPGNIKLSVGDARASHDVVSGEFYSFVLLNDGSGSLVRDQAPSNPAQASLAFYNLSDLTSVALYVPQADVMALANVPAGGAASVALKAPLTLDFEVRSAGKSVAFLPQILLRRRNGTSIVLTGRQGFYKAIVVDNQIGN